MTDNQGKLTDTAPLGKSVEEVEQDSQNQVNSPVDGEDLQRGEDRVPAVLPAYNQGGLPGGNFGVAAVPGLIGNLVGGDAAGPDDGRNDKEEDDTPA